jgi:hypothetical protein
MTAIGDPPIYARTYGAERTQFVPLSLFKKKSTNPFPFFTFRQEFRIFESMTQRQRLSGHFSVGKHGEKAWASFPEIDTLIGGITIFHQLNAY